MGGFKAFLLRGNVVDISIGIVIGAAFGAVITAFVEDLVTPVIGAMGGTPDFSALTFTVNRSEFRYGAFLNALIAFLAIAAAVYYFVVMPYARFKARFEKAPEPAPATKACSECLSAIPKAARKCAFCASPQTAMA